MSVDLPPASPLTLRIRRFGLFAGPALFAAILFAFREGAYEPGEARTLAPEAVRTLAVLAWVATWWLTEPVSSSVASLLPFVLLPATGVMSASAAARGYQEDAIFLFFGGFLLAFALESSGVHRRMADAVLRAFGTRPRAIVLGFSVATTFVSMWLSNAATTLLLLPAALAVGDAARERAPGAPGPVKFSAALALTVAICSTIGGLATPVGTVPNMILVRHAVDAGLADEVTFFAWAKTAFPVTFGLFAVHYLLLTFVTCRYPAVLDLPAPVRGKAAPWTPEQRLSAGVFGVVVLLWLFRKDAVIGDFVVPGWADAASRNGLLPAAAAKMLGDGVTATAAAIVLFLVPPKRGARPLLHWDDAERRVPWGVLFLLGSSFVLADAFKIPERAGPLGGGNLSQAMAGLLGAAGEWSDFGRTLFLCGTAALVSEVGSNTAVAALCVPVGFAAAASAGRAPLDYGFAVAFGASCSFALPVSTPPNTLVYATKRVPLGLMLGHGLLLDLFAAPLVAAAVAF
jgi:sodium-dependent dicarboxylate transporter 2/3/5